MFKKYLRNISMFFLCIFATFVYFKNDDVKKEAKATNIQTVIFKDQDETLIPVSVISVSKMRLKIIIEELLKQ